jgi:hypothetical protein
MAFMRNRRALQNSTSVSSASETPAQGKGWSNCREKLRMRPSLLPCVDVLGLRMLGCLSGKLALTMRKFSAASHRLALAGSDWW